MQSGFLSNVRPITIKSPSVSAFHHDGLLQKISLLDGGNLQLTQSRDHNTPHDLETLLDQALAVVNDLADELYMLEAESAKKSFLV